MRPLHRFLVAAFASACALAFAAAPASAQVSSLTGENLVGTDVEVVTDCHATGTSTITFHAEGQAFGPYSGTFVEDGKVEIPGIAGPPSASTQPSRSRR